MWTIMMERSQKPEWHAASQSGPKRAQASGAWQWAGRDSRVILLFLKPYPFFVTAHNARATPGRRRHSTHA